MTRLVTIFVLTIGLSGPVIADVWKWVDSTGKTHFVDTMTPIYTWIDENGKRHYSDTPGHEDAVSVELVWHSGGTLDDVEGAAGGDADDGYAYPGDTLPSHLARVLELVDRHG